MKIIFSSLSILLAAVGIVSAQVPITTLGPAGAYTQNFTSLAAGPWTDNSTVPGWYYSISGAPPTDLVVEAGGSNVGGAKNYGSEPVDRALGSLASGGAATLNYGVRFVNNSGAIISGVRVEYVGEQWRLGASNTVINMLSFSYRQAATVADINLGIFTAFNALDFGSPTNVGTAPTALDGNLPANRTAKAGFFSVTIPVGEEIMLRWQDINDGGNDNGLAVDDVRIIFFGASTAAPSNLTGRVTAASGRGIANARVLLVGGTGTVFAMTNAFGYYRFEGVETGRTYQLTVSSKRHQFSPGTRTVSPSEDLTDLDFVSVN